MEVVYEGIRLTTAQIVNAALEEGVHVVGLSILSGSHVPLVLDVLERMRAAGMIWFLILNARRPGEVRSL